MRPPARQYKSRRRLFAQPSACIVPPRALEPSSNPRSADGKLELAERRELPAVDEFPVAKRGASAPSSTVARTVAELEELDVANDLLSAARIRISTQRRAGRLPPLAAVAAARSARRHRARPARQPVDATRRCRPARRGRGEPTPSRRPCRGAPYMGGWPGRAGRRRRPAGSRARIQTMSSPQTGRAGAAAAARRAFAAWRRGERRREGGAGHHDRRGVGPAGERLSGHEPLSSCRRGRAGRRRRQPARAALADDGSPRRRRPAAPQHVNVGGYGKHPNRPRIGAPAPPKAPGPIEQASAARVHRRAVRRVNVVEQRRARRGRRRHAGRGAPAALAGG